MEPIFPFKQTDRPSDILFCPKCKCSHLGRRYLKDYRVAIIPEGVDWEMDLRAEYPEIDPVQVWPDKKVMWIPESPNFPEDMPTATTAMVCPECFTLFYYTKYGHNKYTSDTDLARMLRWVRMYQKATSPF